MNWEAIGAIGEIVGALAVFGTLLYLVFQLKQVRTEFHLASLRDTNQQFANIFNLISASPELAKTLAKADEDVLSLTPWEMKMLDGHLSALLAMWETLIEQISTGALKNYPLEEMLLLMGTYLDESWVPGAWERIKKYHGGEWRELVDSRMPDNN